MYGADCIHDPPSKAPPTPNRTAEEQANGGDEEKKEGLPAHSIFSPSATLDNNLVGWDGPDDPQNPQNWGFGRKCFITFCCILMALDGYVAWSLPLISS
jgi:DHA1 family multidrug resistance protein-like MFS transporter